MTAPVSGPRCTTCNRNRAVEDGLCRMHHPRWEADRRARGAKRNPRFAKVLGGLPEIDRAKVPTVAKMLDRLLDVADAVERGSLDPSRGQAIARLLDLAVKILSSERDRVRSTEGPDVGLVSSPKAWLEADETSASAPKETVQ